MRRLGRRGFRLAVDLDLRLAPQADFAGDRRLAAAARLHRQMHLLVEVEAVDLDIGNLPNGVLARHDFGVRRLPRLTGGLLERVFLDFAELEPEIGRGRQQAGLWPAGGQIKL